jgi:hypothetical protein
MLVPINYDIYLIQNKIQLLLISFKLFYYCSARFIYLLILLFLLKRAQNRIRTNHEPPINLSNLTLNIPCEQQVLIELAINSGDFW